MSIEANCPGCGTKVGVPESLLGKRVKCPRCSQIFTAEEPNAGYEEVTEEEDRPRRKRRPVPADDYEEDDRYEDDDYEPQQRRRRGGRRAALEAVKAPAIALMVVGCLGLGYAALNALLIFLNGVPPMFKFQGNNVAAHRSGVFIGIGLTFIWGIIVPYAGLMMLNLRNRSSVTIGAIFAMLPCNLGCLLGLPFGIWALVVLNRPDVSRAFE
jgi:predicted Zn finger-like uncharacterized protein